MIELRVVAGDEVAAGDVIAVVDGRPVFALEGSSGLPRDIGGGDEGDDVERLRGALANAGFTSDPSEIGFGPSIQAAAKALYESAGQIPLTSSDLSSAGQPAASSAIAVAKAQSTVRVSEAGLDSALASLRQAEAPVDTSEIDSAWHGLEEALQQQKTAVRMAEIDREAAKSKPAVSEEPVEPAEVADLKYLTAVAEAQRSVRASQDAVVGAESRLAQAKTTREASLSQARAQVTTAREAVTGAKLDVDAALAMMSIVVPRDELFFIPKLPARVFSVTPPKPGASGPTGAQPLVTIDSGDVELAISLTSDQANTLKASRNVTATVDTDDGVLTASNDDVNSSVVSSDNDGTESNLLWLQFSTPAPASTVGKNLKVVLRAGSPEPVIAVPAAAVKTSREGQTTVTVIRDGSQKTLEVTVGAVADGWVQILAESPNEISVGTTVVLRG